MQAMHYVELGQSGYHVSRICFGTLTMAPICANLPLDEGAALLRLAYTAGINFFGAAQYYNNYAQLNCAFAGNW